jgi:hypothetical protein
MNRISLMLAGAAIAASVLASSFVAPGHADDRASPIFGVRLPAGYRQWPLIGVSHVVPFDEVRGIVGNAIAVKAYREGKLPFPDGAIMVKLAWKHVPLAGIDGVFVAGPATKVQVMVKDAKKFAATGGWGFGSFMDGKPGDTAEHQACFACHEKHAGKGKDYVFTRFAR